MKNVKAQIIMYKYE